MSDQEFPHDYVTESFGGGTARETPEEEVVNTSTTPASGFELRRAEAAATQADLVQGSATTEEDVVDVNLDAMNREELNAYALKVGVENPEGLPNKGAVADAIVAKVQADDDEEPAE